MHTVDIPTFQKEVLAIVESNREKTTNIETSDDLSTIKFSGKRYSCKVTLNEKWIGYELQVTTPDGMGCGLREDTDLYPIHGGTNEEIALKTYTNLLTTIRAIFDKGILYSSNGKSSYTARKNLDGMYTVIHWKHKKILFLAYSSGGASQIYSESELNKLHLNVLT